MSVPLVIVSGCTTQMATQLQRVVCCISVVHIDGEQHVTVTLGAQLMEELLVDNLDTVVVRLVSDRYICHYILYSKTTIL